MKNKKKIALGAAALAVVLVAAGTFAWFTTTDKVENVFGMDNFDVTITEDFDKPDVPLLPGTDVTKQVGVTNSGNVPVVVRVKLEETLALLEQEKGTNVDKLKVEYLDKNTDVDAKYVPVLISDTMITAYTSAGYDPYTNSSLDKITVLRKQTKTGASTVYSYLAYVTNNSSEGSENHHLVQVTPQGGTPEKPAGFDVKYAYNVKKNATPNSTPTYSVTATHGLNDTLLNEYYGFEFHSIEKGAVVLNFAENVQIDGQALAQTTTWYLAKDGYFYYTKALAGETISEPLLKSVSIKESAGNALKGATYTLTPVMEAVQMDWEAAKAAWGSMPGTAPTEVAVVEENAAAQLVFNIINSDGNKGYHTGA